MKFGSARPQRRLQHWKRRALAGLAALGAALPGVTAVTAAVAPPAAHAATTTPTPVVPGYWLAASDGGIYGYDAPSYGSMRGIPLTRPVVGAAATATGKGYWMVASDGGMFSYGDARFHGSTGGVRLNKPIVAMAADPVTGGYWFVASDGGVFAFDAPFLGSTGGITLNKPVVAMASTPDGLGYWLVASDGGVFAYGDAQFYGSTGGVTLARPIVGMASTPDGKGYWMVASDGGMFSFGDAHFYGSTGGQRLSSPVTAMATTADGKGYWLAAADGGVFTFGDAPFLGSAGGSASPAPIRSIITTTHGSRFPAAGALGYDVSQWQCGSLPAARNFAVVQVSGGAINSAPNPCFKSQAQWAGPNLGVYIFGNGLPSPAPSESLTGPAGTCGGSTTCEGYNFGWWWARHWVSYASSQGVSASVWWLDVESGYWSASTSTNAAVIRGAIDGLRSMGVAPGIYSTALQFPRIAGSLTFPGLPVWVAGADYVTGDAYSATSFCTDPGYAFAGGTVAMVQYGYVSGPPAQYDPDYACI